MTSESPRAYESEATLIVCSSEPDVIAQQIAGIDSLAGFKLIPRSTLRMRDTYYLDLSDKPRHSVRTREVNGEILTALKGPGRKTEWGGVSRLEIEGPWSEPVLREIVNELRGKEYELPLSPAAFARTSAKDVMNMIGIQQVQDRETSRQVRDMETIEDPAAGRIAEMVVDSVVYHLPGYDIRHFEVEVEEKKSGYSDMMRVFLERLAEHYHPHLRPWAYNKLAVGMAIERLLPTGVLQQDLGPGNMLTEPAYRKILENLETLQAR